MTYLIFVAGLALLLFGGDWLVRGAAGIAMAFRVPPLVIGLTVVGFGTSMPELMVSVDAALRDLPGIAIGNVIGSNIANILLIIGLSALAGPLASPFSTLRRDLGWMLVAALALVPVFMDGIVSRTEGGVLFAMLLAYLGLSLRHIGTSAPATSAPVPIGKSALVALLGLGLVLLGAKFLVDSSVDIARTFGVSEAVIGLTIVAVGTSLPELATSMVAVLRGQRDIALGNVIGSNIFNILGILGLTAIVTPIPLGTRFLVVDVPVLLVVSLGLTVILWARGGVGRPVAGLMVLGYGTYVWLGGGA